MKVCLVALLAGGLLLAACDDNTTCLDVADDPMNCGACGNVCKAAHVVDAVCIAGSCAYDRCADGFADCDGDPTNGCELDTTSDPMNCGGCGMACDPGSVTALTCVQGVCGYAQCAEGHGDCDGDVTNGCEADLASDPDHCGACGTSCDSGSDCESGQCKVVCSSPLERCGTGAGFCTLTDDDPANCGACGTVCKPQHAKNPACVLGACGYDQCESGWADCNDNTADGCETCLSCDIHNCGGCAIECQPAHTSDPSCDPGGPTGGTCTYGHCDAGWDDCDNIKANGCETDILHDDAHCGGCSACPAGQHCNNGTCA